MFTRRPALTSLQYFKKKKKKKNKLKIFLRVDF